MIARENLDERQRRLLHLLTALFEQQPFLDTTSAAAVYPRLRVDLIAAGVTDSDFECLTEHLIGLVIEHGSALSPRETIERPAQSHQRWQNSVLSVHHGGRGTINDNKVNETASLPISTNVRAIIISERSSIPV